MKNEAAIYVSGGCVMAVRSNKELNVILFDVDNMKEEGMSNEEIDKKWDMITKNMDHSSL